jgi:type II secretory pathway pseudopilin PulG
MAWESAPPPNYPTPNPYYLGNALSNLVGNYQQAQQGQQQLQLNNLRQQQDQQLLDQSKAFAGGVPMNPNGTPNYSAILKTLAEKGDINAIGSLGPLLQQQQQMESSSTPSPLWGGSGLPGGGGSAGGFMGSLHQAESGDQNIYSKVDPDPDGPGTRSQGYDQINVPTWREFAPKAGVDLSQYPTPMSAPESVQDAVADQIPLSRFGDRTRKILESEYGFGDDEKNLTVGQLASRLGGGGGGTKVASLGDSDATAYATPDTPAVPPLSAAAGSTIPRADGRGSTPKGAVGGAPAASTPPQWAEDGPAWAGINASLPVGPSGAPAPAVRASAPQALASPSQGTVASIASAAGVPALVAANIAKAVGVAPGAPLTPQQELKAQLYVKNYAKRTGQQPPTAPIPQGAPGGQGQPSQGAPIIPQVRLPKGFSDPQEAILAIDQEMARLSNNPYAAGQVRALQDWRDRIAAQSAPMAVHPGETLLDPRTGKTLYQAPAAATARMTALQDKADDIADAIKSGDQPPVLTGLYGVSPLVRSALSKDGFDLSKAQLEWDAAKKQVQSLNGPQQTRFVGLANSVVNTIDEVKDLSEQMQNSGVPLLNKAKMAAYINAEGNSDNGQLATRYMTAVNTLKEEFAGLAQGGYAPTESAWKLADQQINGNYGVKQLGASLTEVQRLIKYRLNAIPGMSSVGPGAANPYMPGSGQAAPQGASASSPPSIGRSGGGGAHPPGNYNYDPATGNLEPVK